MYGLGADTVNQFGWPFGGLPTITSPRDLEDAGWLPPLNLPGLGTSSEDIAHTLPVEPSTLRRAPDEPPTASPPDGGQLSNAPSDTQNNAGSNRRPRAAIGNEESVGSHEVTATPDDVLRLPEPLDLNVPPENNTCAPLCDLEEASKPPETKPSVLDGLTPGIEIGDTDVHVGIKPDVEHPEESELEVRGKFKSAHKEEAERNEHGCNYAHNIGSPGWYGCMGIEPRKKSKPACVELSAVQNVVTSCGLSCGQAHSLYSHVLGVRRWLCENYGDCQPPGELDDFYRAHFRNCCTGGVPLCN